MYKVSLISVNENCLYCFFTGVLYLKLKFKTSVRV